MNVQFAMKDDVVYVLEVNPRASRTVPFVSKATGVPLAKIAAKVMVGRTLEELGCKNFDFRKLKHISVKEAVFPVCKISQDACVPWSGDAFHRRSHGNFR